MILDNVTVIACVCNDGILARIMANELPDWRMFREFCDYHNRASPVDWLKSLARKLSRRPGKAQYNPLTIPPQNRDALEQHCILEGNAITDLHSDVKQHKFWLDCRDHFRDPNFVAGYCDGEDAHFIMVKWKSDGGFHGQPATWEFLFSKGAR